MPKLPKKKKRTTKEPSYEVELRTPAVDPTQADSQLDLDQLVASLSRLSTLAYEVAAGVREWRDRVEREQRRLSPDQDDIPF